MCDNKRLRFGLSCDVQFNTGLIRKYKLLLLYMTPVCICFSPFKEISCIATMSHRIQNLSKCFRDQTNSALKGVKNVIRVFGRLHVPMYPVAQGT